MQTLAHTGNELFIVAVGASAGGLEAIHEFFDNVPDSTNLSFVVIQHLSSDYKSLLVDLVSKHTHMQVQEARHQLQMQPGYVYVIPNDKILRISGGSLMLSEKEQDKGPNLAIDSFLHSLAQDQKKKAIAVILSGTGTDGTRGAESIKECGGIVIAQEPSTAKFDGMPKSVIAAGLADFILSPDAMADEIYNHIDGHSNAQSVVNRKETETVNTVLDTVRKYTGYDFHQYKPATILRRISRRILHTKKGHIRDYQEHLLESPDEAKMLAKEFFIGVTSFFRDREAFDSLYHDVFPQLIFDKNNGDVIKIWVTACSTGQEAYSLAILLDRFLQRQNKVLDVKIFASDIDESAIEFASRGKYPLNCVGNIESEVLQQYFIRTANDFTVIPRIRKQIVFARHNILKDPPFIKNDLVSCRNLLIYLNSALQQSVLSVLNFSLKKGGFLFLGSSENSGPIGEEVEEVNAKWKIYKKYGNGFAFKRPTGPSRPVLGYGAQGGTAVQKVSTVSQLTEDFRKTLAEEHGYAAIYINENYEVKEVVGDFKRYLSLPDKVLNLNVLRMVPVELSGILSTTFRKVLKENNKVSLKNVRVRHGDGYRVFNITVQPPQATSAQNYLMVLFGEVPDAARSAGGETDMNLFQQSNYIQELEEELKETRSNLQMAIEGLETTNEELQSANEELQSANEELQSSNEELQSLNEELHTLNTEHQLRIKELVELNDDLNNYFRSTEIGQIFLDSSLRIRKFNPAATKIVNIIDSDIGRPISNISTNIRFSDLVQEVRTVMEKNTLAEKEVELNNGVNCLMRILPYVRQDKRVDGVVISFVDVSVVKELNSVVQGVFDTSISGILVFESERNGKKITDFRATAANGAAEAIFRKSAFETVGESFCKDFPGLAAHGLFDRCIQVVETGESLVTELSIEESEGNVEWYHVVANKLKDGLIMTFTNISRRKQAEDKLRRNYNELLRTKESLKQLNAQLELMVQTRTKDLAQSEERFRLVASSTSDAIWDWNFADNTVWWSDSFYTLFGYPPEAAGINTSSFRMSLIHADDRERVQNSIHELINSDVTEWKQEYRLRKSDGSYATILDRGTVMHDENGVPFRMLGAMMDITMAAQTQEQLRTKNFELQNLFEEFKFVTDFMPQMVWSTKADGNHDFYNQRWYDYTGLNFEATRDKGWELVLHPDDLERTWKIWDESLATGKTYEIEYRIRRHDGVYRWFLGRAIPLRDAEGQIVKWFGTCTDVHDQKTMSDVLEQRVQERTLELQRSNQDLESSNNELMQFASIASHDLKEPLRKIHIFSTLIRDRYFQNEPHGASDYLDRIIRSSSRMTKLINDLLNYSRLSAESLFTATNLNQIVEEVLTDIELAVDDKDAKILVESLPVVEAIPGQMRQIFQNLISNSLKFCREGVPPRVEIGCELIQELKIDAPRAEQGPYVRITLKDNGIGFDEQYAAKIFTIFQRLHSREKYDGTGIGLAIAKKIIEKHNGIISAFSKEGEGATFVIVLPLKQPRLPE